MGCEQEIRDFVIDNFLFGESSDTFSDTDSFLEKGLIDSMGILTLVEFVRDKYVISIQDEELIPENWDSVQRIADFVENKLQSRTHGTNPSRAFASAD
jgi:acyl carrier protein